MTVLEAGDPELATDDRDLWQVGANLLLLGREGTEPGWLVRRTERAMFMDASSIRRTVECHLRLDVFAHDPSAWPLIAGELYLPLARVARGEGAHRVFSIVDEAGATVPRLTKSEERRLVLVGVLHNARTLLDRAPDPVTVAAIGSIVYERAAPVSFPDNCHPNDRMLCEDTAFMSVLQEAHGVFYIVAAITPGGQFGRRVVTYSYDDEVNLQAQPRKPAVAWLWPRRQELTAVIDAPAVADCRSYHFELFAPPDVAIPSELGSLTITRHFEESADPPIRDNDPSDRRAHFFYDGRGSIKEARIEAPLRLAETGLTQSMELATVVAGVLTAVGLGVSLVQGATAFTGTNTEPWVTLLVVGPAIVAAMIAIRSGHGLTSWMSRDARLTTALPAFSHFCIAVLLAMSVSIGVLQLGWTVGMAAAVVACARLVKLRRARWRRALEMA